ncbi:hypothetical protein [Embleya sp. MST-111070]|uniref:hypothetical protein n=1 Tax=Embleya sp. MST-111070 TaxID=3398231 RepID=UPI003F73604B
MPITFTSRTRADHVIGVETDWFITYRLPDTATGDVMCSPDCADLATLRDQHGRIVELEGVTDIHVVQRVHASRHVNLSDLG